MKLKTKITFITILIVFVLFVSAMIINTLIFYREAKEFRESEIKSSFNFFLEKVNFATLLTESIGFDLAKVGEQIYNFRTGKNPKIELETYLKSRMVREKSVLGAGFWFEPNVFGEKYMGPYISWDKENLKITWEYSNPKYDYHNKEYYRLAIPTEIDKTKKREKDFYLVPPYMDKIGDREILFVTLSSLMYDLNGKILGITTVDWTLEDLTKLLSQFNLTKNSYTTLIDINSSKIVFHPNKNFILQDLKKLSWTSQVNFDKIKKNEIQIIENSNVDGIESEIFYTLTSSNFLLAAIINKEEAYSIVRGIVFRNFLLSFITLGLIGIFIFFVVDLSIKPLGKIIKILRGIASGDVGLEERILIKSKDEFGELANSFNQMASTIENQNKEIKNYSDSLEDKVAERTSKLEAAKEEIEDFNKFAYLVNSLNQLDEIFLEVSKYTYSKFGIQGSWLLLPDEKKEFLVAFKLYSYTKLSEEKYNYCLNIKIPLNEEGGMVAKTFYRKKPLYFAKIPKPDFKIDREMISFLNLNSILMIPLIRKNECVGMYLFSNFDEVLSLSKTKIQKLSSMFSQIAGAVDMNHLLVLIEKSKQETEELNKLVKSLNENLNLSEIMKKVHNYIRKNYNINYYGLTVLHKDKKNIISIDNKPPDFLTKEEIEKMNNFSTDVTNVKGAHALAFQIKEPLYIKKMKISQLTEDEIFIVRVTRLRGLVILPLILQNELVGFLDLYDVNKFDINNEQIKKLSLLGDQLAGIIVSSNLIKEVQEEKEKALVAQTEVEKLNGFTKLISSTSDLSIIYNYIFDFVNQNFGCDSIWMLQVDSHTNEIYSDTSMGTTTISNIDLDFFRNFREKLTPELGSLYLTYKEKVPLYVPDSKKTLPGTKNKCINEFNGEVYTFSRVDFKILIKGKYSSTMQFPLIYQNEVLGILCLTSSKDKTNLNKENLQKLIRFIDQIVGVIYNANLLKETEESKKIAELEKEKSNKLLLNILPEEIAKELKEKGSTEPVLFEEVSVMFTDFKGFTEIAETLSPNELIKELDACFVQFDKITERFNLEKLKTIGDSYMCAGGIPKKNKTSAIDSILAAMEIQSFMDQMKTIKETMGYNYWELRLGIHTGPLVAGVIGEKKFAYDVWGDTVNIASRMESSGTPGKVNISGSTYHLVKNFFECEYRGKIEAKNKGEVEMYYVNRLKAEFSKDESGLIPNKKFWGAYVDF